MDCWCSSPLAIAGIVLAAVFLVLYHPGLPLVFHIRTYWIIGKHLLAGGNPLKRVDDQHVFRERVWLSAMDFNLHMNNAVYNSLLDFARLELYLRLRKHPWDVSKMRIGNGGVCIYFLKELRFMQPFVVRTFICDFDRKWLYFASYFESANGKTVHAVAVTKVVVKERNGKTIPPRELFKHSHIEIPAHMQQCDEPAAGGASGAASGGAAASGEAGEDCKLGLTLQSLLEQLQHKRELRLQGAAAGATSSGQKGSQ